MLLAHSRNDNWAHQARGCFSIRLVGQAATVSTRSRIFLSCPPFFWHEASPLHD
jgi:hypothetical protein